MRAVLASAGMGPEHVAKFTTYLSAAVFVEPFYQVREKVFADWYPGGGFPPNTLLVVARLVQPDFMVEIEAVAARAPGASPAGAAAGPCIDSLQITEVPWQLS